MLATTVACGSAWFALCDVCSWPSWPLIHDWLTKYWVLFCVRLSALWIADPLQNVVTDNDPLTPNHFLIMGGNFSLAWANVPDNSMLQRRWRHAQVIANHLWKRWLREYLPELNRRQKWLQERPNLKVGDLVLVMDENAPRGRWPLGKVDDVNVGRDGLVRSVRLSTQSSQLVRPISKIVFLEGAVDH